MFIGQSQSGDGVNARSVVLMCPPDYFTVAYEINPWMHTENLVSSQTAKAQWQTLYQTVLATGCEVKLLTPQPGLPDLVFIDAGFLWQNVFVPSNFRFPERQPEAAVFADWFAKQGYEVRWLEGFYFEGHGDTLWLTDKIVYCGYGFRSQPEAYTAIQKLLADVADLELRLVELIDPRFYHLDTCFCPLDEHTALAFPQAIESSALARLRQELELIEVTPEEAEQFICNSLVVGKQIIMPFVSERVRKILENKGFSVHQVSVSEFMKSGGACKCLCMPI